MADQTFAVHCGFFDAINSDRTYSADEMNRPYKRVISNGVFATPNGTPSTDLQVVASSGMNIICKKGEGLFGDKWFENPSGIAITVPSNTGTVPRIDSVIVQVDTRTSGRVGNIVHRTGTPSSSPVPPAINQVEGVKEYRLANIRVNAGVSAITQSMITDRRGSSDCPWVTSLIYQVDTSTLYDQWQAAYAEYFEQEKAVWDAWYAQLTEDLDVSMTLDRHTNTVTTTATTAGTIPIGLAYNHNTDILEVYINGLRAVEGTHYVVVNDDTSIQVENRLQIGQEVTFVVMRSVISGSATNIMVLLQELESQIAGIAGGTPTVVDSVSDMTDTDKIYILSTDGKWYYYSATQEDWVIGGTYGGVPTDTTLTQEGMAADAKAVGDALADKADSDDVTSLGTRVTGVESDIGELKNALDELAVPLTLVATYQGKQARATGLTDSASNTVYQFEIPDNCEAVHITSYFFGNSRIIFTNSATPIDFSTGQYQQYPSTGYNNPTDIDDDYATLRFKYVYVTFLVTQGKECKASCSAWDIINFIGSNTPIANNTTGGLTDFNNAERNHIYVITSGISNIQNYPPIANGGTLLCYSAYGNTDRVQLFMSNQSAIFIRIRWDGVWKNWFQITTNIDVANYVSDNTITPNKTTGGLTDLNDAERNHMYVIASGIANISNYPPVPNGGTLLCFSAYGDVGAVQLFVSNKSAIYMRIKWDNTWKDWIKIPTSDDIEKLENYVYNHNIPEYWNTEIENSVANIRANELLAGNRIAEFLFLTDTHWTHNAKKSPAIVDYLSDLLHMNIIFGGDVITSTYSDKTKAIDEIHSFYDSFERPVISVLGNHDFNPNSDTTQWITMPECYALMLKQQEGIKGMDTFASPYYWKLDNESQKVRIIGFRCDGINAVSSDIVNAVKGLINDLASGWNVVLLTHGFWYQETPEDIPSIAPNVQTVINALLPTIETANASVPLWVVGHSHKDLDYTIEGTTKNILVVGCNCDAYTESAPWHGETMTPETDTEQAITCIQLDLTNNKVYTVRIGAGQDRTFTLS